MRMTEHIGTLPMHAYLITTAYHVFILLVATGDVIIHGAGDVMMRCDASIVNATNNVTTLTYVSERYYFFRCDVFGSRRLIWKTSDSQPFTVASFTPTGRIVSDDEVINYLVERVEVGDKETNTNFTSYLWFHSENYKPEFVQCASAEFSTTAFFGNLQHLHFFV